MELQVHLFGKLCVHLDSDSLDKKMPQKVQELLCYLLIHRHQSHPRDTLAEMLWSDQPSGQARRYLSKALWQLQLILGEFETMNQEILSVDQQWIQLNPRSEFWLDVNAFENAYLLVQDFSGSDLTDDQTKVLECAIDWYRGDLLESWYQDWCLIERERLNLLYINMLEKLMSSCEANGKFEAGQEYGFRILRYDLAHERTHRKLMRLLYLGGNRTGALRQYRRCCDILKEELGVMPSQSTQALHDQICNDKVTANRSTSRRQYSVPEIQNRQSLLSQVHALRIGLEEIEHRLESNLSSSEADSS